MFRLHGLVPPVAAAAIAALAGLAMSEKLAKTVGVGALLSAAAYVSVDVGDLRRQHWQRQRCQK